jgi:protein-S-isoprenylcysteine O-methyltransferase Ste14
MSRIAAFIYGTICYLIFFGTFLYAIGFVGNVVVPRSIDGAPEGPVGWALLVNLALLGLFALQHSIMARPAFKRWWIRIIPPPVERSTYVLFSSLALIVLFWQWQPMGGMIWEVHNVIGRGVLFALFSFGWLLVLVSTFLINHFDLFGLRQVYLYLRGREYTPLTFGTPGPYKYVRHPLYVGWLFAFWATPTMTAAHLVFALLTTAYILIAIQLEERDLLAAHGKNYAEYRRRVPMLMPRFSRTQEAKAPDVQPEAATAPAAESQDANRLDKAVEAALLTGGLVLVGWYYYGLYQALLDYHIF